MVVKPPSVALNTPSDNVDFGSDDDVERSSLVSADEDDDVLEPEDARDDQERAEPTGASNKRRRLTSTTAKGKDFHRPPTNDELISLRETQNLFHSNLFQLQISEMLKEITPSVGRVRRTHAWIAELSAWLRALPACEPLPVERLSWLRRRRRRGQIVDTDDAVHAPVPLHRLPVDGSRRRVFGFAPPTHVLLTGAWADETAGLGDDVELLLEMPSQSPHGVQSADVTNARFVYKRALYVAYLAWQLGACALVSHDCAGGGVHYTLINDDPLRPALLLYPAVTSQHRLPRVRLMLVPPRTAVETGDAHVCVFGASRLSPRRSNIHSSWLPGGVQVAPVDEPPTPGYNASIQADAVAVPLLNWRTSRLAVLGRSGRQALRLMSVWLRQRELCGSGEEGVCRQLMCMLLLYLHQMRRVSPMMSGYQMLRSMWAHLSAVDWSEEGISLVNSALTIDQPTIAEFHQCFDVVFVDPTGYHNLACSLPLSTYRRLRDEATRALHYLDSHNCDSFQVLFMTPLPFVETFDHVAHVGVNISDDLPCRECPLGGRIRHLASGLITTLSRALGDRVLLLDYALNCSCSEWSVKAACRGDDGAEELSKQLITDTVMLGLRINAARLASSVDRGPIPMDSGSAGGGGGVDDDTTAVQEFRRLWGERVQTRRFHDGQVQLAVHWPAATAAERRMIVRQIVLHVLRLHHGIDGERVTYAADGVEAVLADVRLLPSGDLPYGSGEEAELRFLAAHQQLATQLRRLRGLPLAVAAVYGASAAHRHAAPFPPLAEQHRALAGRSTRHACCQLLERQTELAVPWCCGSDVVVQLEASGKWPQDGEAVRRVRTAFHLQICEELRNEAGLTAACRLDHALIICQGYVFRVRVTHARHPAPINAATHHVDTATALTDAHTNTPQLCRLTSALAALQVQYPAYSVSCRLAVRWVSAQMMSGLFPDIVAELLMAEVFVSPAPYVAPQQPCVALLRWLRRLAQLDWLSQPVLVDFTAAAADTSHTDVADKLGGEQWRTSVLAAFAARSRDSLPPLVVCSTYDHVGVTWTSQAPCRPVLVHAQKLAWQSLAHLTDSLSSAAAAAATSLDWRVSFRPPLELFHVVARVRRCQCVRRHQAVDADGPVVRLDAYERRPYEALPPAGAHDPVTWLVADLRATYADVALVWYDAHGGRDIGVLLKPSALTSRPLAAQDACGVAPEGIVVAASDDGRMMVAFSIDAMVDYIRVVGSGIVEDVEVRGELLASAAMR